MKILIVNAGSSSLKYQLIDMDDESTLAKGLVEKIGLDMGKLKHKAGDKEFVVEQKIDNHVIATQMMLDALTDPDHGVVKSMDEIGAVGHRVLHGGPNFTESVIVNKEVEDAIEENIPLGPLHNPANLAGIRACQAVMPNTPMVAVFDTAFHMTMPPKAYRYGVPKDYYTRLKVRRYGFHGTSHRYVSGRVAEYLGKKPEELRIINCHLGNGSSVCAIKAGKCVDTSMGITPLDCNKKSGLLGISGVSSDMREVTTAAKEGNEDAQIAWDMLVEGVRKYIGAYAAVMNGVDVISFAGGIGENDTETRARILQGFDFIGAKMDLEKNAKTRGVEADLSAPDSKVKILVIPTNEELAIARDTLALVTK